MRTGTASINPSYWTFGVVQPAFALYVYRAQHSQICTDEYSSRASRLAGSIGSAYTLHCEQKKYTQGKDKLSNNSLDTVLTVNVGM